MLHEAIIQQIKTRTIVIFHLGFLGLVLFAESLHVNINIIISLFPIVFTLIFVYWIYRQFSKCNIKIADFTRRYSQRCSLA